MPRASSSPSSSSSNSKGRVLRLFVVIGAAWLPALVGRDVVRSTADLYPLVASGHPYFVPAHAWTLYVWTPLVVASACLLFLSPGLFLSLALNAGKGVGQWVLSGLALSLAVVSAATGAVQALLGSPVREGAFATVVVACSLGCFSFLMARIAFNRPCAWPIDEPHAASTLLSLVVVPMLLLVALTPKFYWENLNGDGAHALESARLLLYHVLPFWPPSAGDMASFPGVTSMLFVYPTSWFIRLFGEVEASARLPLLLELVGLYGAVIALVELGRSKLLGLSERWLIWMGISVYVVVMAFSATYNQYSADIALPATQDTLTVVCFLGFLLGFLRQQKSWMYLFLALTFLSLPNGVILVGFWLLAALLMWRPRPWARVLEVVVGLVVCLVTAALLPRLLGLVHEPTPGGEYGPVELLRHFAWLQWADWRRLAFMVVPGGILPAAGLLAWRWQNQTTRALVVLTVAYFAFFYVTAHIVLHYFVPVMLLPLVVFWQTDLTSDPRRRPLVLAGTALAGLVALVVSLPADATVDTSARLVGSTIEDRIGGYETLDPGVYRRSELLYNLFPVDWDPRVPDESYGGSALAWNYYAHQTSSARRDVNYVLQRAADPVPVGMRLVAEEGSVKLYVRSDAVWASQLALRPPTPAGSPVYAIARGILFRSVSLKDGPPIIDVVSALQRLGVNVAPVLNRLGVMR